MITPDKYSVGVDISMTEDQIYRATFVVIRNQTFISSGHALYSEAKELEGFIWALGLLYDCKVNIDDNHKKL
jgi:hypothetical protein